MHTRQLYCGFLLEGIQRNKPVTGGEEETKSMCLYVPMCVPVCMCANVCLGENVCNDPVEKKMMIGERERK